LFHLQSATSEERAKQTFALDSRSGTGSGGLRVADLQSGMGSVRSRRYYPAYSIRKAPRLAFTTHDEEETGRCCRRCCPPRRRCRPRRHRRRRHRCRHRRHGRRRRRRCRHRRHRRPHRRAILSSREQSSKASFQHMRKIHIEIVFPSIYSFMIVLVSFSSYFRIGFDFSVY